MYIGMSSGGSHNTGSSDGFSMCTACISVPQLDMRSEECAGFLQLACILDEKQKYKTFTLMRKH